MAEFRMPSLGADMAAGTLVEWKVKPGDAVTRGQIVAEVETDKGVVEIEVFEDGVMERLLVSPGTKVPVGTPLAVLQGKAGQPLPIEAPRLKPAAPPEAVSPGPGIPSVPTPRARVSPLARRMALERGLDVATLKGTGPEGTVTAADVEAAAGPPAAARMRMAIAAAMSRSKREVPHYYLASDIDVGGLVSWLSQRNGSVPLNRRMLIAVPLLRAAALALREVPGFNGYFVDNAFRLSTAVHLGVAISLRQGGLVAPAVHDADQKSLEELRAALDDLVRRVRAGSMRGSELADATVTVTSLGDQGVSSVFGVIFPPQVALLGLGRITQRPWVAGGNLAVRPVLTATLSADHRVSDGIQGAKLLAAFDRLLQNPEAL